MRGHLFLTVILLFTLLLVAACGGDSGSDNNDGDDINGGATEASSTSAPESSTDAEEASSGSGSGKPELTIGWLGDFGSLDPAKMVDTLATEMGYKIYSSLVRIKPGTVDEIVGDLAEEWEISADGLVYTFNLREDAVWHHDYGPVTAEDVRFSFLRHKDEAVGSQFIGEGENIQDITVVDDHTVEITMVEPYPGFLKEFAAYRPGFIVNEQALADRGDRYNEQPVGSGPYILENWSPRERVDLVRNDDYYGNAGNFERVSYVQFIEEATQEIALERGEIDIAYFFDPETQARVTNHDELESKSITGPRTYYLQLNEEHEPFNDVRVRLALWLAIDKDLLVEAVLKGQGEPTDTLLNPHVFGRLDERANEYDPERAKQLLAEAGYPDGFEFSLLTYDGELIPQIGVAIQGMWSEIGVNAEITQREWAQHVELRTAGNFDVALQPQLRLGPDQYLTPLVHSVSIPYPNASRFSNAEIDVLIDEARTESDDNARLDIYYQIQRRVHEEIPVIPLVHPVFVLGFQPELQGAEPGIVTINVTDLTWTSE